MLLLFILGCWAAFIPPPTDIPPFTRYFADSIQAQPVHTFQQYTAIPISGRPSDLLGVVAIQKGFTQQQQLSYQYYREDIFRKQVIQCLRGDTPYLKGSIAQLTLAQEISQRAGVELLVFYILSESKGYDQVVSIQDRHLSLEDPIAVQAYSPQIDYALQLSEQRNAPLRWLPSLEETQAADAVNEDYWVSDRRDRSHPYTPHSTAQSQYMIVEAYAVRKDYYTAFPGQVQQFRIALHQAQQWVAQPDNQLEAETLLTSLVLNSVDTHSLPPLLPTLHYWQKEKQRHFLSAWPLMNFDHVQNRQQALLLKHGLLTRTTHLAYIPYGDSTQLFTEVIIPSDTGSFDQQRATLHLHTSSDTPIIAQLQGEDANPEIMKNIRYTAWLNPKTYIVFEGRVAIDSSQYDNPLQFRQQQQLGKNTAYRNAVARKEQFIAYCKQRGLPLDERRCLVRGITDDQLTSNQITFYQFSPPL